MDKSSRLYLWFPASVFLIALYYVGGKLKRRLNPTLRAEINQAVQTANEQEYP